MKNKRKIGNERVFIDNDLSLRERKIREKVLKEARELKSKGEFWRIGFNKVIGKNEDLILSEKDEQWLQKRKD